MTYGGASAKWRDRPCALCERQIESTRGENAKYCKRCCEEVFKMQKRETSRKYYVKNKKRINEKQTLRWRKKWNKGALPLDVIQDEIIKMIKE